MGSPGLWFNPILSNSLTDGIENGDAEGFYDIEAAVLYVNSLFPSHSEGQDDHYQEDVEDNLSYQDLESGAYRDNNSDDLLSQHHDDSLVMWIILEEKDEAEAEEDSIVEMEENGYYHEAD